MATAYVQLPKCLDDSVSALVPFSTDIEIPGDVSNCLEPLHRFYHFMHTIGAKAYLYGGFFSETIPHPLSFEILYSTLHIFDPSEKKWTSKSVDAGVVPLGLFDAASTILNGNLYTYGGTDASGVVSNYLHQLDIKSMKWSRLLPVNPDEGPMPKVGCGMVAFAQNLGVFGGLGIDSERKDSEDEDASNSTRRRTNEFHWFDLELGTIHHPACFV